MVKRKKKPARKTARKRGGTLASYQRAISGNKGLKAAKAALKKAEARKKKAYKKAVAAAKKKVRAKR